MISHILVVCIANTCRSPMLHILLQHALLHKKISSAGIKAKPGSAINPHSANLLSTIGLDSSHHMSQQLTTELCQQSDLILVMENAHIQAVLNIDPTAKHKIHLAGRWQDNQQITDP